MTNYNEQATAALSDSDFVAMFETVGPIRLAKLSKVALRNVYRRRTNLERKYRRQITSPAPQTTRHNISHPGRVLTELKNGIVLVGSDGHYWPGPASTAHRAFVKFCKDYKPAIVVMNGDAFDGSRISRHPSIMWENKPTVIEEIEAVQVRLHEIELAAPKSRLMWPLGNHDARFETRLSTTVPDYAKVHGFHLKDHVGPRWEPCWSVWINESVVIKHRYKGGIHATHNNTVTSGKTMVTGHLHSLKVTPYSDYAKRPRWGVDCGCLAEPYGPQFQDYTEDAPRNHRSGFIVLTFRNGELLWPEIVHVFDDAHVEWRGELIKIPEAKE
jgi:hypothetical protein